MLRLRHDLKFSLILFALFVCHNFYSQTTTIIIDSLRYKPFIQKRTECVKQPGIEPFRNDQIVGHSLFKEEIFFYPNGKIFFLTRIGLDTSIITSSYYPLHYFLDKQSNPDNTTTEIYVVNMEMFGGLICHQIEYDVNGIKVSDKVISKKKFNTIAKKRNKDRNKLVSKRGVWVLALPSKDFGK